MAKRSTVTRLRDRARSKRTERRVLRAAGQRIDIEDDASIRRSLSLREDWQDLAWDYYDGVGELKYIANFLASACGKVRLFAAQPDPDDPAGKPIPMIGNGVGEATDALDALRGTNGTHSELLAELAIHFTVPGACYLIGLRADRRTDMPDFDEDRFFIASVSEVERGDRTVKVRSARLPTNEAVELLKPTVPGGKDGDYWARLWRRHPRRSDQADSAVRGVLSACELLTTLDRAVRAIMRSRIATGSIVTIPDDLSFGAPDPAAGEAGDGEGTDDPLLADIEDAFVTPVQTEGSAAQVAPYLIRYPVRNRTADITGALKSGIEVIRIDRPLDAMIDQLHERALRRLGQGLNVNVERIFGLGEAAHWGGGMIEESDFRDHVEPLVVVECTSLTEAYFHPLMSEIGRPDVFIWYDAEQLIVRTDRQQAADFGHSSLLISNEAWREARGFDEKDAPDDDEVEERIRIAQALAAPGIIGVPDVGEPNDATQPPDTEPGAPEPTPPAQPNEPPPAPAPPPPATTGAVSNVATLGQRLGAMDRMLRLRVHQAAESALERAIERAEARILNKARASRAFRGRTRGLPAGEVVAALGGSGALDALSLDPAELMSDAFEGVRGTFVQRCKAVWSDAVDRVGLPAPRRRMELQTASGFVAEAGDWLVAQLRGLGAKQLLAPRPVGAPQGEFDPDARVPFGIVRQAVARAGGNRPRTTDHLLADGLLGDDIWESFGIAISDSIFELFSEVGVQKSGYVWVYGVFPRKTFEPHLDLDGTEFEDFDDPVLANSESFPPGDFYAPGDHDGCMCDLDVLMQET